MFRTVRNAFARLSPGAAPSDGDLAGEVRTPDPYVWRLPNPHDSRWRRWARRSRAAGHRLAFLHDEECWQAPTPARAPLWETTDDVVRPYVLRP
ncbi:hypothetical protein [Streptomyces sp. NPDC006309]|uniref:hypothetical protein n=1 Tax=Streptomyces sp. NPDC006309 TaxID=3156749 RepID=UPI0033A755C7